MASRTMTGKEAHDYLIHVRDNAGGVEGFVEGDKEKRTMAQQWSELYNAANEVKRGDNVPAALVKRIHEAYPDTTSEPVADAPQG